VLDFGGALGSHYFQNKEFLKPIKIKKWIVVEQERYVKVGKEKIADGVLDFARSIDEIDHANILIASSVIQYLEKPYE
jgi:putative methyltransferase (TIGR04325 family)